MMDPVTKALIQTIGGAGYVVSTRNDDGRHAVEAKDTSTGEIFVVRADTLYDAAVELAQQVGVELEDG